MPGAKGLVFVYCGAKFDRGAEAYDGCPAGKNNLTFLAIRVTIQTLPWGGFWAAPRELSVGTTSLTTTTAGAPGYSVHNTAGDHAERSKDRQMSFPHL